MDRTEVLEQLDFGVKAKVIEGDFRVIAADDGFAVRPSARGRSIVLDQGGTKELFKATGLNLNLKTKAEHDALATVMTQALQSQGGLALMVNEDGQATGLLPEGNRGAPVVAERALASIERGLKGEVAYQRVIRDGLSARIDVIGERVHPVYPRGSHERVNDLVGAGVTATFSPVGSVVPAVQGYVLRQVCSNGIVITETLVEYKFTGGGDEGTVYNWLKGGTRMAEQSVGPAVETFRALAADEVPEGERAATLEALLKDAKLPENAADAVRAQAIERPPVNQWEMLNLVTWATTHLMDDPRQIRRAEGVARDFAAADTHARICPTCRRN